MTDKPGLICPICLEGLASLDPTARCNLVVRCLRCGYEFPFVQGEELNDCDSSQSNVIIQEDTHYARPDLYFTRPGF